MSQDIAGHSRNGFWEHFGRHTLVWYVLAVGVALLDQLSKVWIVDNLDYGIPLKFTSFFNFTLLHNPGAAFSFLHDAGGWQRWFFAIVASTVSLFIALWLARIHSAKRWEPIALALVLGGAIGNLYDRITLGYVVDFIVVHYENNYFPAFNIADSAISAGAFMLVLDMFISKKRDDDLIQ